MTTQLAFNSHSLKTIEHDGKLWFTAATLAVALEYSRGDKITQIYNRNSDEFTSGMSINLNLRFNGLNNSLRKKSVRVFSLRGAHLIAMFASTPVAKEFRKWVLDLIDKEVSINPKPQPPKRTAEPLTHKDMSNLKHMIYHMTSGMNFEGAWNAGIWYALRAAVSIDKVCCKG